MFGLFRMVNVKYKYKKVFITKTSPSFKFPNSPKCYTGVKTPPDFSVTYGLITSVPSVSNVGQRISSEKWDVKFGSSKQVSRVLFPSKYI